MPLTGRTAAELETIRLRLLEILASLGQAEASALRHSLWSAARALDLQLRETHMPAGIDLDQGDEATQDSLYDFVVWDYFSPRTLEDEGDISVPSHTPEQCGLSVFFEYGRWFVTWVNPEVDSGQPEAIRRELLVFEKDEKGELVLAEV